MFNHNKVLLRFNRGYKPWVPTINKYKLIQMENFLSLNLEPTLIESLAKINFKTPTPIQSLLAKTIKI